MAGFEKVARAGDIPSGQGKEFEVDGKQIAIFNIDGDYRAINNACPHVGGPLSEGTVEGNVVTCPWHRATFDLTNGSTLGGPSPTGVSCYTVRIMDGEIEVEV